MTKLSKTRDRPSDRVRRVGVTDPVAAASHHHYADAFELVLDEDDRCSPEEWLRAGVEALPAWIKRAANAKDGLAAALVVASDAGVVVLEDSDRLVRTVLVGRNLGGNRRLLTTILHYRRPLPARTLWAVVGMLHRRVAPRVVAGGLPLGTVAPAPAPFAIS